MSNPLSDVQIFNQALARIGSTQVITSFNDSTNEAAQANVWYYATRDWLLRMFPWPWATVWGPLAKVSGAGVAANPAWQISYRYPPDCLRILRVLAPSTVAPIYPSLPLTTQPQAFVNGPFPWNRADGDPEPVPFAVGGDGQGGRLIFTDMAGASLEYIQAVTDPSQFAPDFASLLAWAVAKEIGMALARSDDRRKYAEERFQHEWVACTASALNEAQRDTPYIDYNSEFTRERFSG